VFSPDLLTELLSSKYKDAIVIDKNIELTDNMEQVVMKGKQIMGMQNVKLQDAVGKAVGIAKFSPENIMKIAHILKPFIAKNDKSQNFYGMIRKAVLEKTFHGVDANGYLLAEVNTVEDLEKANQMVQAYGKS
jgi:choline kinase